MTKTINYRPTWAEIDLSALRHNLKMIENIVGNKKKIMPIVKANAYGHGIVEISKVLIENGISYLGVATVDEAMCLRNNGVENNVSILVLGSVLEEEAFVAVKNDITLTLGDQHLTDILIATSKKLSKKAKVHVNIDTGMGRLGIWHEDAIYFLDKVSKINEIEIEGVYTHFASVARDKLYTAMQADSFQNVLDYMNTREIKVKYIHSSNSIATVDYNFDNTNMVRTGILLYGIYPKEDFVYKIKLKPVMTLKTRIVFLKTISPGMSVSYGRTYIAQKETMIATVPIGYADGYGRVLSNHAQALVKGKLVNLTGVVTMDQTLFDVNPVKGVKVGDEVVLFGYQGRACIPVEKISRLSKTIPYEILAGISNRVPRKYIK
ncbi:MAG: alanine racemase [Candidatus Omnitrophica bacterium]|nr:alanine racemase [Candidatus Omnitrophota bacterium]